MKSNDKEKETIHINSKVNLDDLKSLYILKLIFNNLPKKRYLEMIKYNKKSKLKLNVSTNDYKEYMELYSSIELEIKPMKNEYDKFININKKEEECFYHIYFNNEKEEIRRNHLTRNDIVSKNQNNYRPSSNFIL